MHFTLVTIGLATATMISSSSALEGSVSSNKGLSNDIFSKLGHPSGVKGGAFSFVTSGISGQYPPGDTPGTDDGIVKQFFRGTRDAGDAALDSTAGLAERILDPGNGKNSISTGEGSNGIKGGAFASVISGFSGLATGTDNDDVKKFFNGLTGAGDTALKSTSGPAKSILGDDTIFSAITGITGQYTGDTPGTDNGAVKQTGRV